MSDNLDTVFSEANAVSVSAKSARLPKLNNEVAGVGTIVKLTATKTRNGGAVVEFVIRVDECRAKAKEDFFKAPVVPNPKGQHIQVPFFLKQGKPDADAAAARGLKETVLAAMGKTQAEVTPEKYAEIFAAARGDKQIFKGVQLAFETSFYKTKKGFDMYATKLSTVQGQTQEQVQARRKELEK